MGNAAFAQNAAANAAYATHYEEGVGVNFFHFVLEGCHFEAGNDGEHNFGLRQFAAFAVAGIAALLMRIELTTLGPTITADPTTYNVWLYTHGAVMILGFQIPALTGFFANYCIPLMIGAKDVAFPRINALSVWLFYLGVILALFTFLVPDPPDRFTLAAGVISPGLPAE